MDRAVFRAVPPHAPPAHRARKNLQQRLLRVAQGRAFESELEYRRVGFAKADEVRINEEIEAVEIPAAQASRSIARLQCLK